MITPSPRGYPNKSAIHDAQFSVREAQAKWNWDDSVHRLSVAHNRAANPLAYLPKSQAAKLMSKLDSLDLF